MASFDLVLDPYFGLFVADGSGSHGPALSRSATTPDTVPDPETGRPLKVATIDGPARAICPSCEGSGEGGFVSFVGDLRLAYACPSCVQLVWLPGA